MSGARTRTDRAQRKIEPVRQPGQEPARQQVQGPAQAAYRRAQVNRDGLTSADLLALQRTVGNRQVQRMVARRIDHANGQPQDARWQLARQSQTSTIV